MAEFTNRELQKCAERELSQRRRVYARWVADGRMKQEKADREIALMAEIGRRFGALADEDDAKGRLL